MPLQPFFTFQNEITRLNQLYWISRYSLRCLDAAFIASEKRLPSLIPDEKKNLVSPLPQARVLESSRVAAVLHACSAFEYAVGSYFALGVLYRPQTYKRLERFPPLPGLLADGNTFKAARIQAQRTADEARGGKYTARLALFAKLGVDVSWVDGKLDAHQLTRHKVAHEQAIDGAEDPTLHSEEVIASRTSLTEAEWKAMLGVFSKTITRLDAEITRTLATDHGLSIAVARTMEFLSSNPTSDLLTDRRFFRTWPSGRLTNGTRGDAGRDGKRARKTAATDPYEAVCGSVINDWSIPAVHRSPAAILYRMGLVEHGRGNREGAADFLRRALKLSADPEVEAALKRFNKKRK